MINPRNGQAHDAYNVSAIAVPLNILILFYEARPRPAIHLICLCLAHTHKGNYGHC